METRMKIRVKKRVGSLDLKGKSLNGSCRFARRRSGFFLILLVTSFVFMIFCFNVTACEPKEKEIKIGNQTVLSGDFRLYGLDQLVSVSLAASELSPVKIGGIEYDIRVITKDDEGNVEKAFLVSKEMVEENVSCVIGSTFNGTTEASIPTYMEYRIPILTPSAQATELSKIGDNFFRLIINNRQKVENIANFIANDMKPQRLVLIDDRTEYSVNLVDLLGEILKEMRVEVANRYSIENGSEDMNVIVENLLLDEPDLVFFCTEYDNLAYLVTRARDGGLGCRFMTEELGMDDRINLLASKEQLEGLIAIIPEPPSIAKYTEDSKAIDFWRKYSEFARKMKDIEIEQPGPFAPYSYDAVYVLIEAMKKSNSILPEDFIDELRSTSYDGVTGHIEFDSNGDRLNPQSTIFVMQDGSWVRYQK